MGFPKPVDARLTAPLVLPAESGKPLTTQGGITLDDGSGNLYTDHILSAGNSVVYIETPILSNGTQIKAGTLITNVGVPIQLNQAANLSSGTGAPTIAGTAGDFFFRTDTPTTADQRIYVCTVTGAAGAATWVGIV
jgi:hypothetical protein